MVMVAVVVMRIVSPARSSISKMRSAKQPVHLLLLQVPQALAFERVATSSTRTNLESIIKSVGLYDYGRLKYGQCS